MKGSGPRVQWRMPPMTVQREWHGLTEIRYRVTVFDFDGAPLCFRTFSTSVESIAALEELRSELHKDMGRMLEILAAWLAAGEQDEEAVGVRK